jgi:hypothetical protein
MWLAPHPSRRTGWRVTDALQVSIYVSSCVVRPKPLRARALAICTGGWCS